MRRQKPASRIRFWLSNRFAAEAEHGFAPSQTFAHSKIRPSKAVLKILQCLQTARRIGG